MCSLRAVVFLLCVTVSCALPLWLRQERNRLIYHYAIKGIYTCSEIAAMLAAVHGFYISIVQLRHIMRELHVNPRRSEPPHYIISRAVHEQLASSGSVKGYRAMWRTINGSYGLKAKRDTVMVLLRHMDPLGIAQRKSRRLKRRIYRTKGPNYVWHADGYDKLKPFGLAIHGCIDGFSRRILWLQVASSNNDPHVIAHYYITCVQEMGGIVSLVSTARGIVYSSSQRMLNTGCPRLVRTDRGTENIHVALIQKAFRHQGSDDLRGDKSHRYGKSTSNQRIEAFWSQLRRGRTQWWITLFKDMRDNGLFTDDAFSTDAVQFCFGSLLQAELDNFAEEWNHHRIRKSSIAETISGIPELLYFVPSHYGADNYLCGVDEGLLRTARQHYARVPELTSPVFQHFAENVMHAHGLQQPTHWKESLQLYLKLREEYQE